MNFLSDLAAISYVGFGRKGGGLIYLFLLKAFSEGALEPCNNGVSVSHLVLQTRISE